LEFKKNQLKKRKGIIPGTEKYVERKLHIKIQNKWKKIK
jgi:hypothetical protein